MLRAVNLKCEARINPLGMDEVCPRFSWQMESDEHPAMQIAYRIRVLREGSEQPVWDSGRVEGSSGVLIPYEGPAFSPRTRYFWDVRLWDDRGRESECSEKAWWETGLMEKGFEAGWITHPNQGDISVMQPCPMMRRIFNLDKKPVRARVYASALGVYTMKINGQPVGGEVLSPGFTSYRNRVQYQTWDVTELLQEGENVISAVLADGWYRGYLGGADTCRNDFGDRLALICQMHILAADGSKTVVCSDEQWKTLEDGPIRYADHYMGVCYDARKEEDGWEETGYDDSRWLNAVPYEHRKDILTAQTSLPVRRIMRLKPQAVFTTPAGETVIDMGQNMVGWLKFTVRGEKGHTLTVRHGEVLDKDGNFYNANYRTAKSELIYTLRGDGEETFEPEHSFFGFRYLKLENWPCEVRMEDFEGVVVCSDMAVTSGFVCSDAAVNRLFENIQWGQRGNFVDIPTDCPQRDERVGWTGDCQAFARTACINMDSHTVLDKWLMDLRLDQAEDGGIPHIVPRIFSKPRNFGSSAWGDAATIVPWTLYQCYGDKRILERQYPSMRKWLEYIDSQSTDYVWDQGSHFGDWLGLDAQEGSLLGSTDKPLIGTAFSAYSTRLTMQAAGVLGYEEDVRELQALLDKVTEAYRKRFITPDGRMTVRTQTAHVLTLHFGLCEEKHRQGILRDLLAIIEERGGHLSTGFVGTPYLCLALTGAGAHEAAGSLLMKRDYPSWLYSVGKGATTMWEHWDGIKPDGSFWSETMNSFNHYAYGAIGEWMMRALAGIDLAEPAYGRLMLHPRPIGELEFVSAWQETPYGRVECGWRTEGTECAVKCRVPAGTTAALILEHASADGIGGAEGIASVRQEGANTVLELGSGSYTFRWTRK